MTGALALPNTDWLAHRFTVSGPAAGVAAFRSAAAGAGAIPWCLDLGGLREEWFLRMLAPPPAAREISVEGARILADTYRDLVGAHHDRVLAAVGCSLAETQGVCGRACPLDLHALVPVPGAAARGAAARRRLTAAPLRAGGLSLLLRGLDAMAGRANAAPALALPGF